MIDPRLSIRCPWFGSRLLDALRSLGKSTSEQRSLAQRGATPPERRSYGPHLPQQPGWAANR